MRAAWIFLGMALAEDGDGESGSRTVVRRSRMHAPGTADEVPADRRFELPGRRNTGARESRAGPAEAREPRVAESHLTDLSVVMDGDDNGAVTTAEFSKATGEYTADFALDLY